MRNFDMRAYRTISCSVTGYRKKMDNLPCEDATKVLHTFKGTLIAVADGHGDKRCLFASVGAKLATRAICNVLKFYLKATKGNDSVYWNSLRREIAMNIVQTFACYVMDDYKTRCKECITDYEISELQQHVREYFKQSDGPMTPTELREKYLNRQKLNDRLSKILFLYGTTVRASVLTDSYLFNCALGDGDTIAVINDSVEWLLPQNEAYGCETASLCEPFETVIDSFVFSFIECQSMSYAKETAVSDTSVFIPAVILSTDGFRNSFFGAALFEKKILDIVRSAQMNKKDSKVSNLRVLYEKLSMESVFQDDISTIIAVRTK